MPRCFAVDTTNSEFFMLLEDLDASGFSIRKDNASLQDMKLCLRWLANFHATFLNTEFVNTKALNTDTFNTGVLNTEHGQKITEQLWRIGTYWHLATRPDELEVLDDSELKSSACDIDQALNNCQFKTLVHGDAKLANFCFSNTDDKVAAVDFQYVGGGCGMKDVAYFIGSCLFEEDCERFEKELLDYYFAALEKSLLEKSLLEKSIPTKSLHGKLVLNSHHSVDFQQLEKEWRLMYPFAWTDFHRFIKGWSPGHWKIHDYSERISREVIASLKSQSS